MRHPIFTPELCLQTAFKCLIIYYQSWTSVLSPTFPTVTRLGSIYDSISVSVDCMPCHSYQISQFGSYSIANSVTLPSDEIPNLGVIPPFLGVFHHLVSVTKSAVFRLLLHLQELSNQKSLTLNNNIAAQLMPANQAIFISSSDLPIQLSIKILGNQRGKQISPI